MVKTARHACPRCGSPVSIAPLFWQPRPRLRCGSCGDPVLVSQRPSLFPGLISGLVIGVLTWAVGPLRLLAWPNLAWLVLFALVWPRVLLLLVQPLAPLEVVSADLRLGPSPPGARRWMVLGVAGMAAVILLGASAFFWRYLPLWAIYGIVGLTVPVGVVLLVSAVQLHRVVQARYSRSVPNGEREPAAPS